MKLKIKNKLPLIRTVAALLVLLTVMGVVTYSWTMGIEKLSIDSGLKTAPLPSAVNQTINLDATAQKEIDLTAFDQLSNDGMYFSEVTSTDGINFKVPDGENSLRDANTNDVGEKFIKFDFSVMVADKCSLRFAEIPTFTVTNSHGATVTGADTSPFRIMIGEVSISTGALVTSKIFTTGEDINGAKQLSTFGTNQDILSFNDQYYPSQHKLIISVWLDGDYTSSTDNLLGNKVKLNLKLKAYSENKKTTIYFEPRSGFNSYYAWVYNSSTSEHYVDNKNWPGVQATYNAENGCYEYSFITSDVGNFRVIVSDDGNNQYPASNATTHMEGEIGGTYLFTANNKLVKLGANDIIVSVKVGGTGKGGTVYIDSEGTTAVKAYYTGHTIYAVPADGYRFAGWYSEPTCNSIQESGKAQYSFTAYPGYCNVFYAKFEPVPTYDITFNAVSYNSDGSISTTNGGYITWHNSDNQLVGAYTTTMSIQEGKSFSVNAELIYSNYEFAGWYTDSACTQLRTKELTFNDSPTESKTYYAKFVQKTTTKTVYFTDNQGWGSVYCHYWGSAGNETTWPGKAMTWSHYNEFGQNVYKVTIPGDTTGMVFNGGNESRQTVDIVDVDIVDKQGYYPTNMSNNKWNVGTWMVN